MKIQHFEEFLCLAETLNFSKTARRFYTSRSVISRHIAALEAEFGTKLLERDSHNVRITEQGKVFCKEARTLVDSYRRLQKNTRAAAEHAGQLVRVGYSRNAARPFIVRFARYVKEHVPNVTLTFSDMRYEDLARAMDTDWIDVAFTIDVGQDINSEFSRELIYKDRFYAIASTSNPLSTHYDGIECQQLEGLVLLVSDSFACPDLRAFLHRILGRTAAAVSLEYCNDVDTMCLRVQMDGGIALQCGYNLPLPSDGLVTLPLLDTDSSFSLVALSRQDLDPRTAEACLNGFLHCRASMEDQLAQQQVGYTLPLLT